VVLAIGKIWYEIPSVFDRYTLCCHPPPKRGYFFNTGLASKLKLEFFKIILEKLWEYTSLFLDGVF